MLKIVDLLNRNEKAKYNKRISRLYKQVFNSAEGQEVLSDLMMNGYILESTEGDNIKEGIRTSILRILGILQYNPQKFQAMTKKITATDEREE